MKKEIESNETKKLSLIQRLSLWKEGLELIETEVETEIRTKKKVKPIRAARFKKDGSDYEFEPPTLSTNSNYSWANFENGKSIIGETSYDLSLHHENQFGNYNIYFMKGNKLFPFVAIPHTSMGGHSLKYARLDSRDDMILAELSPLVKIANKIQREVMKGGNE